MSWRMALAVRWARIHVRRNLARTLSPAAAALHFERTAPYMQRPPPYLRHLVRSHGTAELHWIAAGQPLPGRVILYLHGGAFVSGSPFTHEAMLGRIARLSRTEVCAPRYRLLQEAPFPAAPDDALAAWDALRDLGFAPAQIVIGGDSAGGNLAFGLLSAVLCRGERPAGLFALSPWTDMTLSGGSITRFAQSESILPVERMAEVRDLYLAGADPADPRASPLLADYPDPPPVLLQVGSGEALLDDSTRMADRLRAAGGEVTCDIWPDCLHVWQMADGWLPEARAALRRVGAFVQDSFDRVSR